MTLFSLGKGSQTDSFARFTQRLSVALRMPTKRSGAVRRPRHHINSGAAPRYAEATTPVHIPSVFSVFSVLSVVQETLEWREREQEDRLTLRALVWRNLRGRERERDLLAVVGVRRRVYGCVDRPTVVGNDRHGHYAESVEPDGARVDDRGGSGFGSGRGAGVAWSIAADAGRAAASASGYGERHYCSARHPCDRFHLTLR